jgi:hypothetical protein
MGALKTKTSIVALVLAAAAGFYFFGQGSKTDHSKDRRASMNVEFDLPRTRGVQVRVTVNGREVTDEWVQFSPWNEWVWLSPGQVLVLEATQRDQGFTTCAITMEGQVFGPDEAGPEAGSVCRVTAV